MKLPRRRWLLVPLVLFAVVAVLTWLLLAATPSIAKQAASQMRVDMPFGDAMKVLDPGAKLPPARFGPDSGSYMVLFRYVDGSALSLSNSSGKVGEINATDRDFRDALSTIWERIIAKLR